MSFAQKTALKCFSLNLHLQTKYLFAQVHLQPGAGEDSLAESELPAEEADRLVYIHQSINFLIEYRSAYQAS